MAQLTIDKNKLSKNFDYLDALFKKHDIQWSITTKLLCGHKDLIQTVLDFDLNQYCDSRIDNLKVIKDIQPNAETILIKPPQLKLVNDVVKYADISLNSEKSTIQALSKAAEEQGVTHKVIIMIEMGEIREGVMRDSFVDFYASVFELSHIDVVGVGTNLSCMSGVLPNQDKLIQLSLYKQLVEAKFNKKIKYVSGGSSVTIPLIFQNRLPKGINHFRVGETLFFGTDVYNDNVLPEMEHQIFTLSADIIEMHKKPTSPSGKMGTTLEGKRKKVKAGKLEMGYRAIVDLGLLDVDEDHIEPQLENASIAGGSSDMYVVDLGDNDTDLQVGDSIHFSIDYMGALRLLNSKYIDKKIL